MRFIKNDYSKADIEKRIANSQPAYNLLANGSAEITDKYIEDEHKSHEAIGGIRYFIEMDEEPIGLLDFLPMNPKDGKLWLGLLLISAHVQGKGYGEKAVKLFEKMLKEQCVAEYRLGVLEGNDRAKQFWERMGFKEFGVKIQENKCIHCYEKTISNEF